jgi:hypothetical protein
MISQRKYTPSIDALETNRWQKPVNFDTNFGEGFCYAEMTNILPRI